MTIIHVACAGTEHMGRVEGEGWKKAKKRQMLVLYEAVKVIYTQDPQGNVMMSLMDMKKRQAGTVVETKYEGTVYLVLSPAYPYYIWPLQMGGDLHRIYKNTLSNIIQPESKIVGPTGTIPIDRSRRKH